MKIVKKILLILFTLIITAAIILLFYYLIATQGTDLNLNKLRQYGSVISVYDGNDEKSAEISPYGSNKSVCSENLPGHVKNAFIAAEDKNFYKHHGIDYKGMIRALLKNLQSRSFSQGGSTISQQLIKNTQLSAEKTLVRKLKEIKLTRKLEKKFSKEEILECYLNTIYFGHACYGISSASDYYFDKPVWELNIPESATLAGLIRSPNRYSPFVNPEKCKQIRDSVLRRMRELKFINENQLKTAINEELPIKKESKISAQCYLSAVYDEFTTLPILTPYEMRNGCNIYTFLDTELQSYIETLTTDSDRSGKAMMISDVKSGGVRAWYSTENIKKRQPGSAIKPLAVYAPAIEKNLITPATPILDEKTTFGNYAPHNYNDRYYGYVSARQALAQSLNVPAVKILQELGCDISTEYLNKCGLNVLNTDINLALALGGITEGFTIPQMNAAYATFARGGTYIPASFIRKIETHDGTILYERKPTPNRVFSEQTCYLLNDMLKTTAKSGTAKKLAALPFEICAKTGTCGTQRGNTDAWTITYTNRDVVSVWMGNADNSRTDITGGGLPCSYAAAINKILYSKNAPPPFELPQGVLRCGIDKISYEREHNVQLADDIQPPQTIFYDLFKTTNIPPKSTVFTSPKVHVNIKRENNCAVIQFSDYNLFEFKIERKNKNKNALIYKGKCNEFFTDKNLKADSVYSYKITPYFIDKNGISHFGSPITLPDILIKKEETIPKEWWKSGA